MTMQFRTTKTNLVTILGAAAAGRYRVVGYQVQTTGSAEIVGVKRRVQVFYAGGDFDKGKAGLTGPTQHEADYSIQLSESSAAEGNLNDINHPGTDPADEAIRAAAIASFRNASDLADERMDEFIDIIYQILMDGDNVDIGETTLPFKVNSRWVNSIKKQVPAAFGDHVELTAEIGFDCGLVEAVTGDTGTAASATPFDITNDIDGDDNEKSGLLV